MSEKKVIPPGADPGTDDEQITEVELEPVEQKNIVKFAIASLAGLFLFLIPIPRGTSFTIPIGILINWVSDLLELENVNLASVAVLLFITVSTVLTIINKLFHPAFLARNEKVEKIFSPTPLYFVSRILGLIIVYMAFFKVGPKMIWSGATGGSMLGVSATLISVILCIAFLMPLLTDFGIMEFVGVFMRKVVRPLFTVPGRSAIDLVTSWLGTSNAAAILTTGQYEAGFYSAREAATISCNFSFVSIPFCYVIATLLGVEDKFTVFYLISLIGGVVLAMIIPRIPPLRFLPDSYDEISGKRIRENVPVGVSKTKWALNMAGHRAETANGKTVFNSGLHIYATMFGGIPTSEVDALGRYWEAFPGLREELFEQVNPASLRLVREDVAAAVRESPSVQAWRRGFEGRFSDLGALLYEELVDEVSLVSRDTEEGELTAELFGRLDGMPLVDRYDAYQALDEQWQQISIDLEMLQTEGFGSVRRVDPLMVLKKQKGKEVEVQDGWVGRILPFDLVQAELLSDEASKVASLEERLSAISSELAEIVEGLTDEDKADAGDAVNEAGDALVASKLRGVIKGLKADLDASSSLEDSLPSRLECAASLFDEEKETKKAVKALRAALEEKTKEAIEGLDDDSARMLLSSKWVDPLVRSISAIPDGIIDDFMGSLVSLRDKYATTYADIDGQIQSAESELVGMLGALTGDEYDMAGIRELAALLGGEHR